MLADVREDTFMNTSVKVVSLESTAFIISTRLIIYRAGAASSAHSLFYCVARPWLPSTNR